MVLVIGQLPFGVVFFMDVFTLVPSSLLSPFR